MSIEAMKQALENELSSSDFIDKAPKSWDKTERTEWARLQAMYHNIRVFKKAMRQAIAEAEKQKEDAVGFCEVLTMDDVADIVVNAQKRIPPYEINYMIVMQLTEKKVLEKFK